MSCASRSAATLRRTRAGSNVSVSRWRLRPARPSAGSASPIPVSISTRLGRACRPSTRWKPCGPPRAGFPILPSLPAEPRRQRQPGSVGRRRLIPPMPSTTPSTISPSSIASRRCRRRAPGRPATCSPPIRISPERCGPAISAGADPGHRPMGWSVGRRRSGRSWRGTRSALEAIRRPPFRTTPAAPIGSFSRPSTVSLRARCRRRSIELDPLQRGSLIHDVQFELFARLRQEELAPGAAKQPRPGAADARCGHCGSRRPVSGRPCPGHRPCVGGWHCCDPRRSPRMAAASKRGRLRLRALAFRAVLRIGAPTRAAPSRSAVGARRRRPRLRHSASRIDRPRRASSLRAGAGHRSQDRQGRRQARPADRWRQDRCSRCSMRLPQKSSSPAKAQVTAGRLYFCTSTGGFAEQIVPLDEPGA